jgi:hypothetical protein
MIRTTALMHKHLESALSKQEGYTSGREQQSDLIIGAEKYTHANIYTHTYTHTHAHTHLIIGAEEDSFIVPALLTVAFGGPGKRGVQADILDVFVCVCVCV